MNSLPHSLQFPHNTNTDIFIFSQLKMLKFCYFKTKYLVKNCIGMLEFAKIACKKGGVLCPEIE